MTDGEKHNGKLALCAFFCTVSVFGMTVSRWHCMVDKSLTVLFCIRNSINCDKIANICG